MYSHVFACYRTLDVMGPWEDQDLPDVDGVDHAPDQVIRRQALEDAGWRIWKDSHGNWYAHRPGGSAGPWPALRFLLDELEKSTELN